MVVRKPSMRESTDIKDDSVLDGDGADVKTSVLDEDEVVADINDDGDIVTTDDDVLNEAGDTGEDLENIDNDDLDALLNESDEEELDEDEDDADDGDEPDGKSSGLGESSNPIDNLGDKKAPPFTAEDAKEARKKKESEGDDGKEKAKDADDKGDGKDEDEDEEKDGEDGGKDLEEDFDDPAEVLEPALYTDDPVVEEFGEMPDAVPEYPDEPIVELDGDDEFVADVDIESGVTAPVYDVDASFILPESRKIVVARGDRIYYCGKAQTNLPSYAESTFTKAAKMLVQSKKLKGSFLAEGRKGERVALVGRSCLVEIARDWRLPGTDTIFEKGDIIQIVSRKPITEKTVKTKKTK